MFSLAAIAAVIFASNSPKWVEYYGWILEKFKMLQIKYSVFPLKEPSNCAVHVEKIENRGKNESDNAVMLTSLEKIISYMQSLSCAISDILTNSIM